MKQPTIPVSRCTGRRDCRIGHLPARFVDPSQLPPPKPRIAAVVAALAATAALTGCITVQLPAPPAHHNPLRLLYVSVDASEALPQIEETAPSLPLAAARVDAPAPVARPVIQRLPEVVVRMPPAPVAVPVLAPPPQLSEPPAQPAASGPQADAPPAPISSWAAPTALMAGLAFFAAVAIRERRQLSEWAGAARSAMRTAATSPGVTISLMVAWGCIASGGAVLAGLSMAGWV